MDGVAKQNYAFAIHLGASRRCAIAHQRLSLLSALIFAALSLCSAPHIVAVPLPCCSTLDIAFATPHSALPLRFYSTPLIALPQLY